MDGTSPPHPEATAPDAWLRFVRASGREGRRWAARYRRFLPLESMNGACLALLRAGRQVEAAGRLASFREAVDAAPADPPTRAVLERWYWAVEGYRAYTLEAWDDADRAMRRAARAAARAVWLLPALLPLATHCHEFRLHRARIARNRRRWDEMRAHVAAVGEMFEGRRPFCRLPGGGEVGLAEVRAYHRALGPLDGEARAAAERFLDDALRMRDFDRFVRAMYRLPGFVLAYP